jgi:predicted phage baseplate assembly protein
MREPFDPVAPAASAMRWQMADVIASMRLNGKKDGVEAPWTAARDLLRSSPNDRNFVVEIEADGEAQLRFGDDTNGMRPPEGTTFEATYRVGNGRRGNVGAEAIAHIATSVSAIASLRNPLPAQGGTEPETIEEVRRFAPVAFRTQERAVTADDYARMTERHSEVQMAAATFRWTGSWRTVFVTADPLAGPDPVATFVSELPSHLEPYRMAGHDLDVDAPRYVPLEIEMTVCARRDHFRADVKRALLQVFNSQRLPDGSTGVFHPDNFTFGQPLYLSRLYAAAYAVDGVESVSVSKFQRQGSPDPRSLEVGKLEFGRLEIARLLNDVNFPERGVLHLTVAGGK